MIDEVGIYDTDDSHNLHHRPYFSTRTCAETKRKKPRRKESQAGRNSYPYGRYIDLK